MKMKRDYIKKAYGSEPTWDKDIPLEEFDALMFYPRLTGM